MIYQCEKCGLQLSPKATECPGCHDAFPAPVPDDAAAPLGSFRPKNPSGQPPEAQERSVAAASGPGGQTEKQAHCHEIDTNDHSHLGEEVAQGDPPGEVETTEGPLHPIIIASLLATEDDEPAPVNIIREIAISQRQANTFVATFLIACACAIIIPAHWLIGVLELIWFAGIAVYTFRLAKALQLAGALRESPLTWVLVTWFCLGILAFAWLSSKASKILTAQGVKTGLLGASKADIERLSST